MVTLWDAPITSSPYIADTREQLAIIDKVLSQSDRKMIAVEGAYGMGKTFLAKQYATLYVMRYPDGITYCRNYFEFQKTVENWMTHGFPAKKHLIVADELTELAHKDTYCLNNFLECFCTLRENSNNINAIFIGNPVPERISRGLDILTLPGLSIKEAENMIRENGERFGLSKDKLSNNMFNIIKKAGGNPRHIFNLLSLLSENSGALPQTIETIPGLLNSRGQPIDVKSNEYGKIKVELACANDQILNQLRQRPDEIYNMSSREFEMFTASILAHMGYEITVTPQTRDGGIDIFAAKKERLGSFLCLVQCKKQKPSRPVGIAVVRELYGVLQAERATCASVFTTSFFSKSAVDFQQRVEHQLSLVDYKAIKDILYKIN